MHIEAVKRRSRLAKKVKIPRQGERYTYAWCDENLAVDSYVSGYRDINGEFVFDIAEVGEDFENFLVELENHLCDYEKPIRFINTTIDLSKAQYKENRKDPNDYKDDYDDEIQEAIEKYLDFEKFESNQEIGKKEILYRLREDILDDAGGGLVEVTINGDEIKLCTAKYENSTPLYFASLPFRRYKEYLEKHNYRAPEGTIYLSFNWYSPSPYDKGWLYFSTTAIEEEVKKYPLLMYPVMFNIKNHKIKKVAPFGVFRDILLHQRSQLTWEEKESKIFFLGRDTTITSSEIRSDFEKIVKNDPSFIYILHDPLSRKRTAEAVGSKYRYALNMPGYSPWSYGSIVLPLLRIIPIFVSMKIVQDDENENGRHVWALDGFVDMMKGERFTIVFYQNSIEKTEKSLYDLSLFCKKVRRKYDMNPKLANEVLEYNSYLINQLNNERLHQYFHRMLERNVEFSGESLGIKELNECHYKRLTMLSS